MKVVNKLLEHFTVYIGRPSALGNPFVVGEDGTRGEVIKKFEQHARVHLMEEIRALPEDAVLGCWCKPKPCHGDVIVKLWEELHEPSLF